MEVIPREIDGFETYQIAYLRDSLNEIVTDPQIGELVQTGEVWKLFDEIVTALNQFYLIKNGKIG